MMREMYRADKPAVLSLINRTRLTLSFHQRSFTTSRESIKERRCQLAIVDSSHVTIIIHLGNYFANYLDLPGVGSFRQQRRSSV